MLQSNNKNYWKNVESIRKKNFKIVPVIDGTQSDAAIADLFKDKYSILYHSVSSFSDSMDPSHERIRHDINVFRAMHFIYYINRSTATKVDSTYLGY